jgi:hypothetical protein
MNWLRLAGIRSFRKHNPDWDVRLHDTPDHVNEWLLPAQQADLVWLEQVSKHGGFALATDTVFVRPVPDEWLSKSLCVCTNDTGVIYHNSFGAKKGHRFVVAALADAKEASGGVDLPYQALGADLLKHVWQKKNTPRGYFDMPLDGLCPVRFWRTADLWSTTPLVLPEETVGVTWFGGADDSMVNEWSPPENSAIVRLAQENT